MQPITVILIFVKAVHVSGGVPAHYQEVKLSKYSIWYLSGLVNLTAGVVEIEFNLSTQSVAATQPDKHRMIHDQVWIS
jgi:hypothetical protein